MHACLGPAEAWLALTACHWLPLAYDGITGPPNPGALWELGHPSGSQTTIFLPEASFPETPWSLHGELQKLLRYSHGKSGGPKACNCLIGRPHSLNYSCRPLFPYLAARTDENTNPPKKSLCLCMHTCACTCSLPADF